MSKIFIENLGGERQFTLIVAPSIRMMHFCHPILAGLPNKYWYPYPANGTGLLKLVEKHLVSSCIATHVIELIQTADRGMCRDYKVRYCPVAGDENGIAEHIVNRIFERNGFGSWDLLKAAIQNAAAGIEACGESWDECFKAFKAISDLAPMRSDSHYMLTYAEVPDFVESLVKRCSNYSFIAAQAVIKKRELSVQ